MTGNTDLSKKDGSGLKFKGIRKPSEIVPLTSLNGDLTFLARKIFNALILITQSQKYVTFPQPSFAQEPIYREHFWILQSEIIKGVEFNSSATRVIKEAFQSLQKVLFEKDALGVWTSAVLISSVKIVKEEGSNQVWFGFMFPPDIKQLVESPNRYVLLSLFVMNRLRSHTALALYELCMLDLFRFQTPVYTREQIYLILIGKHRTEAQERVRKKKFIEVQDESNPEKVKVITTNIPEYRNFKRDTLNRAIKEVNSLTNIEIELKEEKQGRKITGVYFKIRRKPDDFLPDRVSPVMNVELFNRMVEEFGFGLAYSADICSRHSDESIIVGLERLQKRMKSDERIYSIERYLSKVLLEYAQENAESKPKGLGDDMEAVVKRFQQHASESLFQFAYLPMTPMERAAIRNTFHEKSEGTCFMTDPKAEIDLDDVALLNFFKPWFAQYYLDATQSGISFTSPSASSMKAFDQDLLPALQQTRMTY